MRTLDLALALTILLAPVSPLSGQVLPATAPAETDPDYQIERQLHLTCDWLQTLQKSPQGLAHAERLESISTRIQDLEYLYQLTRRGHPIRTEAQLHSRLGFLKAALHDLAREMAVPFPSKPQAPATGNFSGRVTGSDAPGGLTGVFIDIFDSGGDWVAAATTVAGSTYLSPGLVPGDYYARTNETTRYINELYDDIPCYFICNVIADGQPITVVESSTTADIDFELAPGGSISGTLALADPLDVTLTNIQIFDANGDRVWSQRPPTTNGEYTINVGLPTGTYFARTAGGRPYVNEVWNDKPCPGTCDLVDIGDPITVTAPDTTPNIDFNLDPGVKLSGTVKDAGTQLAIDDSLVEIFNQAAERVSGCRVGAAGNFICWQAIPTGTYHAATMNYAGYIDEVHSDPRMACVGGSRFCDVTQGTPISVDVAVPPDEIHFTLDRGGWFEGSVIDVQWQRGLPGTGILVYDHLGDLVAEVTWKQPLSSVDAGPYATCGLPTGTYYAMTDTSTTGDHHSNELFDDWMCFQDCDILQGTPISVTHGAGIQGIDFTLEVVLFADGLESGDSDAWSRVIP